jgi:hypothetical protein
MDSKELSQKLFDEADELSRQYIVTALWTGVEKPDDDPERDNDSNYDATPEDIETDTLWRMIDDCKKFAKQASKLIAAADDTGLCKRGPDCDTAMERAGHDFWLTRNGHGAGFWDGDWPEPYAEQLTKLAQGFGECDLYTGDDGRVYAI